MEILPMTTRRTKVGSASCAARRNNTEVFPPKISMPTDVSRFTDSHRQVIIGACKEVTCLTIDTNYLNALYVSKLHVLRQPLKLLEKFASQSHVPNKRCHENRNIISTILYNICIDVHLTCKLVCIL